MGEKKSGSPKMYEESFVISDGTRQNRSYGSEDYREFLSNAHTNNEHIEASEYYETFLDKTSECSDDA